jgi:hypothetical protein
MRIYIICLGLILSGCSLENSLEQSRINHQRSAVRNAVVITLYGCDYIYLPFRNALAQKVQQPETCK